jgi:hypothetical protein
MEARQLPTITAQSLLSKVKDYKVSEWALVHATYHVTCHMSCYSCLDGWLPSLPPIHIDV